jgi:hypothetical protein
MNTDHFDLKKSEHPVRREMISACLRARFSALKPDFDIRAVLEARGIDEAYRGWR